MTRHNAVSKFRRMTNWFRAACRDQGDAQPHSRRMRGSLAVELLEDRSLPSVTVTPITTDPQLSAIAGITTDGSNLYVTAIHGTTQPGQGAHPGELTGEALSVPITGGSATLLYGYSGQDPNGDVNPHSMTIFGSNLLWTDSESGPSEETQIYVAPKDGSGSATLLADTFAPFDGEGIATDGSQLYVSDAYNGSLYRISPDGSSISELGTVYGWPEGFTTIAQSNGTVYECVEHNGTNEVVAMSTDGGSFTTITAGAPLGSANGIAVANGTIYIADPNTQTIWSVPTSGGTPTALVTDARFGNIGDMVYYGGALYVADPTGAGGVHIWEVSFQLDHIVSTITLTANNGMYNGQPFAATATITPPGGSASTSLEGVGLTLTYYSGMYASAAQLAGVTGSTQAPGAVGDYTVLASFAGSTDYAAASALANFTIIPAATTTAINASFNPAVAGQLITFTATVTTQANGSANGSIQFQVDGSNLGDAVALGGGAATSPGVVVTAGSHSITATFTSTDPQFAGSSGYVAEQVTPVTATSVQQSITQAVQTGSPIVVQVAPDDVAATTSALAALAAPPSPVTITANLTSGAASDLVVTLPPNVTLVINGAGGSTRLVGGSPALTVQSGQVIVRNVTITNSTNTPTIVIKSGTLTLRNDTVQESAAGAQAAIAVSGGVVDLGTEAHPGGNTLNVNGAGVFIANIGSNPITALGNTFEINGHVLTDPYRIANAISDGLDADDRGVVTFVAGNAYVTHGNIQRAVTAVADATTINVQASVLYSSYSVGSKPLTLAFQSGPTLQLVADSAFAPNTTTLRVTGGPQPLTRIQVTPGRRRGTIDVTLGYFFITPFASVGTFAPTGGIVLQLGAAGYAGIAVSRSIALPVVVVAK
jgi:hypothetical protein